MRVMLKIQIPTAAGNAAISGGALPETMGRPMETLKPEAAYFYPENGKRAALFVFDMTDSSQLPSIAEPLFFDVEADVSLTPVMNADELEAGLAVWGGPAA